MKSPAWHAEARRLRAAGYSCEAISVLVRRSPSAVWCALNPERARAQAAGKRERHRAAIAERERERLKRLRETDPAWVERDARRKRLARLRAKIKDRHPVPVFSTQRGLI